jgi:two-component system response regulator HydG
MSLLSLEDAMAEILVIDDDQGSREAIIEVLTRENHKVAAARSGTEGIEAIRATEFDLVVTDLVMPDVDGMAVLAAAREKEMPAEVVIMTGFGSVETAVEAMKNGAYQYLNKPINIKELREVARKALEKRSLARDNVALRRSIDDRYGLERIIGKAPAMQDLFTRVRQVAPTSASVLITGPSGTGKELIAHAIHNNSPRRNKPFLAFNCGALTDSLIESELFGHERGAFTGAISDRKGYFQLADGGTLLLDEIGEMPLHTQVKLLRVLETRSFFRVGGTKKIDVDVRVLAATNRELDAMIRDSHFREDLYFRLKVVTLNVPPLSRRREDIPLLVNAFLQEFNSLHGRAIAGCSRDLMDFFVRYAWPGNVRELRNLMENMVITAEKGTLEVAMLPEDLTGGGVIGAGSLFYPDGMTMDAIELEAIRIALARSNGNKSKAAERLGMSLRTFHRKTKLLDESYSGNE